jgi:hypothetical protein
MSIMTLIRAFIETVVLIGVCIIWGTVNYVFPFVIGLFETVLDKVQACGQQARAILLELYYAALITASHHLAQNYFQVDPNTFWIVVLLMTLYVAKRITHSLYNAARRLIDTFMRLITRTTTPPIPPHHHEEEASPERSRSRSRSPPALSRSRSSDMAPITPSPAIPRYPG